MTREQPMRKAARLRALLADRYASGRAILCPTAHDCTTAKMIEYSGFEFMNVAGAGPTASWTGEPECGVVTFSELAFAASRILGCVDIPGKANVAQGGNVQSLVRAFREYERAGAALVQIEDQAAGHQSGFIPGKHIVPEAEMIGRIQAARYARQDPDVVIAVRTDAKLAVGGGLDEMLRRCKAYAQAGAEALMPHGLETHAEFEQVARELRPLGLPLIASLSAGLLFTPKGQPRRQLLSVQQLESMGWTLLAYANHLLHIQMTHSLDYLQRLVSAPHDISASLEGVIDNGARNEILGLSRWRAIEEAFAPPEHLARRYADANSREGYVYRNIEKARETLREEMLKKGVVGEAKVPRDANK